VTVSATDLFGPAGTPRVVVVGGGYGGIAAGVKLKKARIHTFTIYEKSDRVGGTWWDNQYPGCEVDVHSHLYSYPFKPYDWSRTHAKREELQGYLEETVSDYRLWSHFRLGTAVDRAVWDEATHTWKLTLDNGDTDECNVLISAVGFLNVPRYPDWPGLDDFEGVKLHSARWEHEHDFTGKTVALVGTGSTATQILPEIQPIVKKVSLFQREPGWVMAKGDRDFTPAERVRLRAYSGHRIERWRQLLRIEKGVWGGAIYRPGTKMNQLREQQCRDFIQRELGDRPDLAEAVTPSYPYPGKRPIFNSTFYAALKQPNVELVPHAVTSVTRNGIVDSEGVEREIDILVMCTGFQPTNYLAHLEVVGAHGRSLHDYWAGEPRAFLGITVPGFPNFFMLYGPGTNGGEIVTHLVRQSEYAVRVIRRMVRDKVTAVEVKRSWADRYHGWLMSTMEGTSWTMSHNYFTAPSGKVVTQWPYGCTLYGALTKILGPFSETARRRAATPRFLEPAAPARAATAA
jgi:cation diffusion facilitator CzcD-associated flavoprotein CzcO